MEKTGKAIKHWVMCFSFRERKKKELMRYKEEIRRFQEVETDALDLEYINMKTEYEHRKKVISIFLLTIVLSALMDIWKHFHAFIESMVRCNTAYQGNELEMLQVVFAVLIILAAFISSLILGILIVYARRMKQIYKNLLIIEEIRKTKR